MDRGTYLEQLQSQVRCRRVCSVMPRVSLVSAESALCTRGVRFSYGAESSRSHRWALRWCSSLTTVTARSIGDQLVMRLNFAVQSSQSSHLGTGTLGKEADALTAWGIGITRDVIFPIHASCSCGCDVAAFIEWLNKSRSGYLSQGQIRGDLIPSHSAQGAAPNSRCE